MMAVLRTVPSCSSASTQVVRVYSTVSDGSGVQLPSKAAGIVPGRVPTAARGSRTPPPRRNASPARRRTAAQRSVPAPVVSTTSTEGAGRRARRARRALPEQPRCQRCDPGDRGCRQASADAGATGGSSTPTERLPRARWEQARRSARAAPDRAQQEAGLSTVRAPASRARAKAAGARWRRSSWHSTDASTSAPAAEATAAPSSFALGVMLTIMGTRLGEQDGPDISRPGRASRTGYRRHVGERGRRSPRSSSPSRVARRRREAWPPRRPVRGLAAVLGLLEAVAEHRLALSRTARDLHEQATARSADDGDRPRRTLSQRIPSASGGGEVAKPSQPPRGRRMIAHQRRGVSTSGSEKSRMRRIVCYHSPVSR